MNKTYTLTITLLSFCFICLFSPLEAQTVNSESNGNTVAPAQAGTYQLIFNNRREDKDIKLSPQELTVIEKLRKDSEVVYARASYSDEIRVKILPRNTINNPKFSPPPLKYYKDEHSYEEYSQIRYVEFE